MPVSPLYREAVSSMGGTREIVAKLMERYNMDSATAENLVKRFFGSNVNYSQYSTPQIEEFVPKYEALINAYRSGDVGAGTAIEGAGTAGQAGGVEGAQEAATGGTWQPFETYLTQAGIGPSGIGEGAAIPTYTTPETQAIPTYQRPDVEFGAAYSPEDWGAQFYGLNPEDWTRVEENLYTGIMRKVVPGLEAELSTRGMARSSEFMERYGQTGTEAAEKAMTMRYGLQTAEQARRTDWEAQQALLKWQSTQDIINRQREFETSQTQAEHMSQVASTAAANEAARQQAASNYAAAMSSWQAGEQQRQLGYQSAMEVAQQRYQDYLRQLQSAQGEVMMPYSQYQWQPATYMSGGGSPWAAGIGAGGSTALAGYVGGAFGGGGGGYSEPDYFAGSV